MHRSKLSAALVDVPADTFDATTSFWSGALGREPEWDDEDPDYADFGWVMPGMRVMTQRVRAAARVHLDIETDDIDAEVSRLEALGAERVEKIHTWWVMRDPGGLLFCVIRVQNKETFEALATTWD
jgi:hypothetical protein